MKKIGFTILTIFFLTSAKAQWNDNGASTTTSDNIGIGTSTTVTDKLEVESSSTGNVQVRIRNTNTTHGAGASLLLYANAFGNRTSKLSNVPDFNGSNFIFNIRKADNSYFDAMTLKDQSNETALWINNQTTLSTSAAGFRVNSQGNNVRLISFADTHTTNANENWFVSQAGGSSLVFGTEDQERMRILANGNVGIGTETTGTHQLAVEGTIGAREIKVEASGWSDFVFENDYELRTLEEVEQHINENGHLPEIPSETEVTENGIKLGEMDSKLLMKIEELTLYMIQLNKEMTELKAKNEQLEKEIIGLKNE